MTVSAQQIDYVSSLVNSDDKYRTWPEEKKKELVKRLLVKTSDYFKPAMPTPDLMKDIERENQRISTAYHPQAYAKMKESGNEDPVLKKYQDELQLQLQGIDTRTDLPTGDVELGFAENQTKALSSILTKHFGERTDVFTSGNDVFYIDPNKKQVFKANPNWLGKIGYSLPMAGDIVGTVGGGAVTAAVTRSPAATVVGESVGSAAGTGTGEFIRLLAGRSMGVNDMSIEEMADKAGIEGAKAGAITMATGGTIALGKGGWNLAKANMFTKDEAKAWGISSQEADQIIKEVNDILKRGDSDQQLKMTMGKRSDDPVTKSKEADLRTREEFAERFQRQDVKDQAALNESMDIISRPARRPYLNMDESVSDVVSQRMSDSISRQEKILAQNQEELTRQLDSIGLIQKERVGEPTREYILKKQEATKQAENKAWDTVRELGEFDPQNQTYGIKINIGGDLKGYRDILQRRMSTAQTGVESKGIAGLVKPRGSVLNPDKKIAAPKKEIVLRNTNQLERQAKPQDLADYSHELSNLKSELRAAKKNKQFGTTSTKDLEDYIRVMEENRNSQLLEMGRPDLLDAIKNAERQTARFREVFDRSMVGDLTKVNDKGIPVISSEDFVDKMLKSDKEQVNQLLNVIGDNPELLNMWKQGLANAYKRKAYPDGRYSRRMSNDFIDQNRPVLDKFFTEAEINQFKKSGTLFKKVEDQTRKLKAFKQELSKWGTGALVKVDKENMVKFITGEGGGWKKPGPFTPDVQSYISKIRYAKNRLNSYPAAWQNLQNDFKDFIRKDVVDYKTGNVDPKSMLKWVSDKGNQRVIKEMLGDSYYRDLVKVNNAVQTMNQTMNKLSSEEGPKGIIQTIRAGVAPPLTRRGRAFTAILIFNQGRAHRLMADALLDETKMKKVAKLAEHNKLTREAAELAASLGFMVPFTEEGE